MRKFLIWALAVLAALLIAVFLLLRTPDTDPAAMRAKYGAPPSQFVALAGGLTVHLRDEGPRDAPVIVLLHGSNADLHTWDAWTAELAKTWRVVRYDQIGHGLTGPSPLRDYSPDAFGNTLDQVTARLGIGRFVLAGNSMGGGIALRYAMTHPERLRGLVLVDLGGAPVRGKSKGNIGFKIARLPGLRMLMRTITPRPVIAQSLRQTVGNQAIVTDAMIDRYWELLRYPGNRQATIDRFGAYPHPASAAQIGAIKVPTLILWGEKDPLIPLEAGKWLAAHIPGARLVVYPGIGHIPMEEAVAATLGDLQPWLSALPPVGPPVGPPVVPSAVTPVVPGAR